MRQCLVAALVATLPFIISSAVEAQGQPLAAIPVLPEAEEIRLAESAAPREISARATILVHGANGLRRVREGSNGYVCFVEWFQRATTMWPVCYEPEFARIQVALNETLERYRTERRSEQEYVAARDSILAALPAPRPGGLSYRLSAEMWTSGPNGKTDGPWMILVTAPGGTREQLGLPPGEPGRALSRSTGPRFGVAGIRTSGYYWIGAEPVRDTAATSPASLGAPPR